MVQYVSSKPIMSSLLRGNENCLWGNDFHSIVEESLFFLIILLLFFSFKYEINDEDILKVLFEEICTILHL